MESNKGTLRKGDSLKGIKSETLSVEIKTGPEIPGHGWPRRNARHPELRHYLTPEVQTLYENWAQSAKKYPDNNSMGYRDASKGANKPFVWFTYKEMFQKTMNFASGLRVLGMEPKQPLGIYSKNRIEWEIAEQAANSQSMPTVSIYDTFGEETTAYIINHAEIKIIISADASTTKKLFATIKDCPQLKCIIQMDALTEDQKSSAEKSGIDLRYFADVEKLGESKPFEPVPPTTDDLAVIMYTSGTTGLPKGVMITHSNCMATITGVWLSADGLFPTDVYMSYLPLAHIFERMFVTGMIHAGGSIGFYSGDPRNLVDDLQELRPTVMAGVPRVFVRIQQVITSTIEKGGWIRQFLFKGAYERRQRRLSNADSVEEVKKSTGFFDSIVFEKVESRLGGRLRKIVSGAAPLSPETASFIRICFGCPVLQGYGLTETTAGGSLTYGEDMSTGHVGAPVPCSEVKLVDVPEMNYFAKNNEGEVWIRGPSVTKGYFKDEKKTAEDYDSEGWFHTGDVGRWNPNGSLSIIDRKKNIFKLAQGEYIAAEKLELIYSRSKYIGNIFVYGDGNATCIIAIVCPEPNFLNSLAEENGINEKDLDALCQNKEINKLVLEDLTLVAKEAKLAGFEVLKGVILTSMDWTPATELVTPTLKLKRPQLRDHYIDQIVELYQSLGEKVENPKKEKS